MRFSCLSLAVGILLATIVGNSCAADQKSDRAKIQQAIESYTAAFNARDAAALATHWGPEAVYENPLTGEQVEGRDAIAAEFKSVLSQTKGTKLVVDVESIRFLSPGVAIEQGVATLVTPDQDPEPSRYTAVHVKHDGKWLLDRISEEANVAPPSHYEQLKGLDWMIGSWLDRSDQNQIVTTCHWARNHNFIIRAFEIGIEDRIDTSGMQIIGWDPANNKIRSWAFDSDGGFAEGSWTKRDEQWVVESNATLPDGQKGSSINIITPVDANTFSWQATGREVDGTILPSVDAVQIKRVSSSE